MARVRADVSLTTADVASSPWYTRCTNGILLARGGCAASIVTAQTLLAFAVLPTAAGLLAKDLSHIDTTENYRRASHILSVASLSRWRQ